MHPECPQIDVTCVVAGGGVLSWPSSGAGSGCKGAGSAVRQQRSHGHRGGHEPPGAAVRLTRGQAAQGCTPAHASTASHCASMWIACTDTTSIYCWDKMHCLEPSLNQQWLGKSLLSFLVLAEVQRSVDTLLRRQDVLNDLGVFTAAFFKDCQHDCTQARMEVML